MPLPPIQGIWRVGTDPELRFAPSGAGVAKFRAVASSAKKLDDGSWETTGEIWVTMIAFYELAEHVVNSVTKGAQIAISGKIQVREYEIEGDKRTAVEVLLDTVNPLRDRERKPEAKPNQSSSSQPEDPPF